MYHKKKGSIRSPFLYVLNKQLLVHYIHCYFKTKTHFCCSWCCPHNVISLYFSNSITNDFAYRCNSINYKLLIFIASTYEIILSIIMIKITLFLPLLLSNSYLYLGKYQIVMSIDLYLPFQACLHHEMSYLFL